MLENPQKIERFMARAREAKNASDALHISPALIRKKEKMIHKIMRAKRLRAVVVWLLILVVVACAAYYYNRHRNSQNASSAAAQAQQEAQTVVDQVGKLMFLPQGENPTIATVSDKSKLGNQAFFKNAEDGDKVLIYASAKLAIIYRPSLNKIVNVAPIFSDQNSGNQAASTNNNKTAIQNSSDNSQSNPSPSSQSQINSLPAAQNGPVTSSANTSDTQNPLEVMIENGTKTPGLAGDTRNKLSGLSGVSIVGTGNAKGNYADTIVVDLTGKNPALVGQIAQTVNGKVGSLPSGETKPDNADVLIIAGNNSSPAK